MSTFEQMVEYIQQPLWDCWYMKEQLSVSGTGAVYRMEANRMGRREVSLLQIEYVSANASGVSDNERTAYLKTSRQDLEKTSAMLYGLRNNPFILQILDEDYREIKRDGLLDGYFFLRRMEYLPSVAQLQQSGSFDGAEPNLRRLAVQVTQGLKAAHESGLIHGDVRPEHIYLASDGKYKIGCFQGAKIQINGADAAYLAPEARYAANNGRTFRTAQTDLYALGMTLCQITAGGKLPESAVSGQRAVTLPPVLSPKFSNLIMKLCASQVSVRYQSAEALAADLRAIQTPTAPPVTRKHVTAPIPPAAPPVPPAPPFIPTSPEPPYRDYEEYAPVAAKSSSRWWIWLLGALLLLLLIAGIVAGTYAMKHMGDQSVDTLENSRSDEDDEDEEEDDRDEEMDSSRTEVTEAQITTAPPEDTTEVPVTSAEPETEPVSEAPTDAEETTPSTNAGGVSVAPSEAPATEVVALETMALDDPLISPSEDMYEEEEHTQLTQMGAVTNIVNGGSAGYDGEYYYYSNYALYKQDAGFEEDAVMLTDARAYYLNVHDDVIYFVNADEDNAICCISTNGTGYEVLYNHYCYELTYYDGWLYFSRMIGSERTICRMKPDGTGLTVLAYHEAWYMNVYADRIFFCNYDDGRSLYAMDLDGTHKEQLYAGECSDLCVTQSRIFFSANCDDRWLYRMNLDGSGTELIGERYTKHTNYFGGMLYYVGDDKKIYACKTDGSNVRQVSSSEGVKFPVIFPNTIFYESEEDGCLHVLR